MPSDFLGFVRDEGWQIRPFGADAAAGLSSLPRMSGHKDPFDRMLIHIAIIEHFHFVSRDASTSAYKTHGLRLCW